MRVLANDWYIDLDMDVRMVLFSGILARFLRLLSNVYMKMPTDSVRIRL